MAPAARYAVVVPARPLPSGSRLLAPFVLGLVPFLLLGCRETAATAAAGTATGSGSVVLIPELVAWLSAMLWYAVLFGWGLRYLRRQGALSDHLAADAGQATARARDAIRLAYARALHDTVLPTLIIIARGDLDYRCDQVRLRCARDADSIRRLLQAEPGGGSSLEETLAEVTAAAEALGLRVHYRRGELPSGLPQDVVDALGGAVREALNNVAAHAGTAECWLTADWTGGRLTVRVVDRGRGFLPDLAAFGFGLRRSVVEPVAAVDGRTRVSSAKDEGTCVEVVWPR